MGVPAMQPVPSARVATDGDRRERNQLMNTKKFISLPELAERLGLSENWLKQSADAGEIPMLKTGTRRMFDPEAVERVLAERAGKSQELR